MFPYGNVLLTSGPKKLRYSRTVTFGWDEGYEIHTTGHR